MGNQLFGSRGDNSLSFSSSELTLIEQKVKGKNVLVTGASSGLGKELSILIARFAPRRLLLTGRNTDRLKEIKQICLSILKTSNVENNSEVFVRQLDMENYKSPEFSATVTELKTLCCKDKENKADRDDEFSGVIDILINNAGISSRSKIMDTDLSVDEKLMAVNFFGPVALTKLCLPDMLEYSKTFRSKGEKKGSHMTIVSINSAQGKLGLGFRSSYGASKHASTAWFDSLRAEIACSSDGKINVLAVFPGYIRTSLSLNAIVGNGGMYNQMDETTAKGESPDIVAKKILLAIAKDRKEIHICPFDALAAILLRNIFAGLVLTIIQSKTKKQMIKEGALQQRKNE